MLLAARYGLLEMINGSVKMFIDASPCSLVDSSRKVPT